MFRPDGLTYPDLIPTLLAQLVLSVPFVAEHDTATGPRVTVAVRGRRRRPGVQDVRIEMTARAATRPAAVALLSEATSALHQLRGRYDQTVICTTRDVSVAGSDMAFATSTTVDEATGEPTETAVIDVAIAGIHADEP